MARHSQTGVDVRTLPLPGEERQAEEVRAGRGAGLDDWQCGGVRPHLPGGYPAPIDRSNDTDLAARTAGGREWQDPSHAEAYRGAAPGIPHWVESEAAVRECLPERVARVLDLGTGDGRLIALVREARPGCAAVGVDFSEPMLGAARARFAGAPGVELVTHDLAVPLPDLGRFDLVVSGFAIHHLEDPRKRAIYGEAHAALLPGGRFLNLEHVASRTRALHAEFLAAIAHVEPGEDPSNRLAPVEDQLRWLEAAGFEDVDCHWKWRELALLAARRPADRRP